MTDLTDRQLRVLRLMADGLTLKAAAAELHVSYPTAKNDAGQVLRRLGARTGAHAVAIGYQRGLLCPDPGIWEAVQLLRAAGPGYRLALVPWDITVDELIEEAQ